MWWLATAALAGPPSPEALEDPYEWVEAADTLLHGPPGCWEVVGEAVWNHDLGQFGFTRGSAVFVGRLVDGVWSELTISSLGEEWKEFREPERFGYRDGEQAFLPLLGQHPDADDEGNTQPENIVEEVLRELSGNAEYAWATWDAERDAVVLTRVVPIAERANAPEVTMTVTFPRGGTVASHALVTFPERFVVHPMPPVVIRNARVELRGKQVGDAMFPSAEAYSAELRVLGFRFNSAQTIRYRNVVRCQP